MKISGIAAASLAAFLASCGAVEAEQEQAVETPKSAEPEFIELNKFGDSAMIVPDGADPAAFSGWAKDRCGSTPICGVFAWTDRTAAARAMPMTDREAESMAFSYRINRNSGYEQALWDCDRYRKTEGMECL